MKVNAFEWYAGAISFGLIVGLLLMLVATVTYNGCEWIKERREITRVQHVEAQARLRTIQMNMRQVVADLREEK